MLLPERYEIVGSPLDGGMGTVLPCKDRVLERSVAIKIIHGSTHRRRMHDELAALLKMRSKHVVQVYDLLKIAEDELGIVQEFIEGRDLFDDGTAPTSTEEFYKQVWQIAGGISDIHALSIIHRDIKPNNMKIDTEGVIKIFDFGLARDEGPSASTMGFVGTRGFAAPELYGDEVTFTAAVDTYAFGATALYLATRSLPLNLLENPPKPSGVSYFSAVPFSLAQEVTEMLDSCLAYSPSDRPNMMNVRDVLARYLLFDRHRALIVFRGTASYLDATNRSVILDLPSMGQVQIHYNGLKFIAMSVTGDVWVNNKPISVGEALPGSCVVALGAPYQGSRRRYITFDLSHPEIVL